MIRVKFIYVCDIQECNTIEEVEYHHYAGSQPLNPGTAPNEKWRYMRSLMICPKHKIIDQLIIDGVPL